MSDLSQSAKEQITAIHRILSLFDGEEALKRIREVLYGAPESDRDPASGGQHV